LAAYLKERGVADVTLERGGGGVFDVFADGRLLYSKHRTQRFPEHGEIGGSLGIS